MSVLELVGIFGAVAPPARICLDLDTTGPVGRGMSRRVDAQVPEGVQRGARLVDTVVPLAPPTDPALANRLPLSAAAQPRPGPGDALEWWRGRLGHGGGGARVVPMFPPQSSYLCFQETQP